MAGIIKTVISGAHVASTPIYTPPYQKQDGSISKAKLFVNLAVNKAGGNKNSKPIFFGVTMWGDRATKMCHMLYLGKAVTYAEGVIDTYDRPFTSRTGKQVLEDDGSIAMITNFMFITITNDLILGSSDHDKVVSDEIAKGLRPADWRGNVAWQAELQKKMATPYVAGPTHGYANISPNALKANSAYGTAPSTDKELDVGGMTYSKLIAAGMSHEQILSQPLYAVLAIAADTKRAAAVDTMQAQIPVEEPVGIDVGAGF